MEDKIKHSENYLKSILGKENGFSAPKNYFENLDGQLSTIVSEERFSHERAFSTPSDYFENLEDNVITKITSEEKKSKVISLRQRMLRIIPATIAASIVLFISVNYFSKTNSEINFDNLAQSEIEKWFLENSTAFTSEDIAMFIPVENISISEFTFADISKDDIEDYIIDQDATLIHEIN